MDYDYFLDPRRDAVGILSELPSLGAGHNLTGMTFAGGSPLAVGLPHDNFTAGEAAGRVLVYRDTRSFGCEGCYVPLQGPPQRAPKNHYQIGQVIEAPPGAPPHFGRALAVGASGLAVSAGGDGEGAVLVFAWAIRQENGPFFDPVPARIDLPDAVGLHVGASLGVFQMNGATLPERVVAVGSPARDAGTDGEVRLFRQQENGNWSLEQRLGGEGPGFGTVVSFYHGSGFRGGWPLPMLAVGTPGVADAPGRVLVYRHDAGQWGLVTSLSAPQGQSSFGKALELDRMLIVGAPSDTGRGRAYFFERDSNGTILTEAHELDPPVPPPATFGSAVAAGYQMVVAAPTRDDKGGLYMFFLRTGAERPPEGGDVVPIRELIFQGRVASPSEPGAGVFAEAIVDAPAGPPLRSFDLVVSFRAAENVTCPMAFHVGPVDEKAGPWPTPCAASPFVSPRETTATGLPADPTKMPSPAFLACIALVAVATLRRGFIKT